MPVLVQINGKPDPPWQINMMPMGDGRFYLYLHGDVRKTSQTKVGDTVTASVRFDTGYRRGLMHPMPSWFRNALETNARAKENWASLPPSRKKEILRYFSRLKSEDSKSRNKRRIVDVLSGGRTRFMGRTWHNGR